MINTPILGNLNLCLGVCALIIPGGAQLLLLGLFDLDLDARSPFDSDSGCLSAFDPVLSSWLFLLHRASSGSFQSSRARAHCWLVGFGGTDLGLGSFPDYNKVKKNSGQLVVSRSFKAKYCDQKDTKMEVLRFRKIHSPSIIGALLSSVSCLFSPLPEPIIKSKWKWPFSKFSNVKMWRRNLNS